MASARKPLSPKGRIGLGIGAAALLLFTGIGVGSGIAGGSDTAASSASVMQVADSIASTPEPTKSATPKPTPSPTPVKTVERETTTAVIPFGRVSQNDGNALVGTSTVTIGGVDGVSTTTFEVTYIDGVESSRTQLAVETTSAPVNEMTNIGTKPVPVVVAAPPVAAAPAGGGCDPNYSGCVPIASDVDCAGGSGNGPAYQNGAVTVIGTDIYDLDRDGDGIACD